jgi:hypothetical protein
MRLTFLSLALVPTIAVASPVHLRPDARRDPAQPPTASVCAGSSNRCHAHLRLTEQGDVQALAVPAGFGPADIRSAYGIDPATQTPATIAIVDAFGYPALESDLAVYRSQFGLPPCTIANGCLTVLNQVGQASPLPDPPPANDDWTIETALDVQMASAVCPGCKLLVVQSNDDSPNMYIALLAAAQLHPSVVSASWGGPESSAGIDLAGYEQQLAQITDVGLFASTGDSGFQLDGVGPSYPATSAKVVAVGGTVLVNDQSPRGWSETAWAFAGSSCSGTIPRLASQVTSACPYRATSDLAAIAGEPGVAIYNAGIGGWGSVTGTSVAAPIVATLFAASGHSAIGPEDVIGLRTTFNDVTSGANGPCGSELCVTGIGWDGPTGWGSPNAAQLGHPAAISVAVKSPHDGDTVPPEFPIALDVTGPAQVGLRVDGAALATETAPPYGFTAPSTLAQGAHAVEVEWLDTAGAHQHAAMMVTVADPTSASMSSGCSAGGGAGCAAAMLVPVLLRRRRRA